MANIIHHGHVAEHNIQPFTFSELAVDTCTHDRRRGMMDRVISGAEAYTVSIRPFNLFGGLERAAAPVVPAIVPELGTIPPYTSEAELETAEPLSASPHWDEAAETARQEAEAQAAAAAADMLARERERILQQAQDEAAQCLASAQEQATALTTEAYHEGLRQGEATAREEVSTQFSPVLSAFQQVAMEVGRLRAAVLRQAEEDVITLAFQLARKIVQHEIEEHGQVLATTLRRALAHVAEQDHIVVRVHPDDLADAAELQRELGRTMSNIKALTIESDVTVGRGGCLVESSLGTIDARIEAQFTELEQRLRMQHGLDVEAHVA